jgi:hypothetical protein
MTTPEAQIPEDGAERQPTRHPAQPGSEQWGRRVSFWRAVAGMAIAIALGCAAVALETAFDLSSRSAVFHRRLELLNSRISRLRSQATDSERQLAALSAERNINRVLSATDVVVLRLTPGVESNARGLLAISRQAGGAIIEVAGMRAAADQTYAIWWLLVQAPPARAAEFNPDAEGRRSLIVPLPPPGSTVAGVIVTLVSGKPPPKGRIVLKVMLPTPKVLS